jgi:FKBP-type peptidyl-prolyl cis-trans isomerase
MKKYADGGEMPAGIQDVLQQRKENMARKRFDENKTAENKSAREPLRSMKEKLSSMFSSEKESKPVKKARGGMVKSSPSRGDGCAIRGKTKGRIL